MTREEIQDYSARVASSNRTGLTVITYDIIITYLNTGMAEYENQNIDEFIFNMKKAKQYVNMLSSSLNMDYAISRDLLSLYLFANETLLKCIIKKKPENIGNVINMMQKLRGSFEEVAKSDASGNVMENAQQIYAGYTYGKTGLNITVR